MALPEHFKNNDSSTFRGRKAKSVKQEKRIAREYQGSLVSGSGSGREKGDVNLRSGFKMEAKRTDAQSMSIKRVWLEKIAAEAFVRHQRPALEIEFGPDDSGKESHWVVISKQDFIAMQGCLQG